MLELLELIEGDMTFLYKAISISVTLEKIFFAKIFFQEDFLSRKIFLRIIFFQADFLSRRFFIKKIFF